MTTSTTTWTSHLFLNLSILRQSIFRNGKNGRCILLLRDKSIWSLGKTKQINIYSICSPCSLPIDIMKFMYRMLWKKKEKVSDLDSEGHLSGRLPKGNDTWTEFCKMNWAFLRPTEMEIWNGKICWILAT